MALVLLVRTPAAQAVQVVVQRQFEHRGAIQVALSGKVFQSFEEALLTAESNHMELGHGCSMPQLLPVCK